MTRFARAPLGLILLSLVLLRPAVEVQAEEAPPGDTIAWSTDLGVGFAKAKADEKILMICVNAKSVIGAKVEPASKGLREVVYKDPRVVVKKSREYVCAFLTPEGSSDEYGELRALGIEGMITAPQHIFVHPDGKAILFRKAYWPYGKGEAAVEALLGMMDKAQQKLKGAGAASDASPPAEPEDAPAADAERAAWIARMMQQVESGGTEKRRAAIDSLVKGDQAGDCVGPLVALFPENKKNTMLLVALIRGLGRDGLELAALPIADQLRHKEELIRGNAAVSLEYIGSREKKVIAALKKMGDKEKDASLANHAYRALGRCGCKDAKTRALLLKKAGSAKSEFASYGPCIGLAYFEGDKKAARGVEKLLKKIGVPGSRRGGGQNAVKRSVLSWTLASIRDAKSGKFVREELMAGLEHVQAVWVDGLLGFWEIVARYCEGEDGLMPGIEGGVRGAVAYVKSTGLARYGAEVRNLMDEYRKDREEAGFVPKGDSLLDDESGK